MAPHSKSITNCIPEEILGLLGNYLKEVVGVVNPHLARVRLAFGRGQGRLLRQLNDYAPKYHHPSLSSSDGSLIFMVFG